MPDFYLTNEGDLCCSPNGDIAITPSLWREYSQQAYVALLTQTGDFTIYPSFGADLNLLLGMPQSPATGQYGKSLIKAALDKNPKFKGVPVQINAVPTDLQTIRFDIYITVGSKTDLVLSVEQNITI